MEVCQAETKNGEYEPFRPTRNRVSDILDALRAITHLDLRYAPPCWLDNPDNDASNFIPVANGLYDIRKFKLWSPTPMFFSTTGSPVKYIPNAPSPRVWYEFLDSLWPTDDESKATLQELMGLLLTGDTSYQKIFLLVGPKRAGKGTIAWVTKEMLGHDNVAGPTLSSLAEHFGLQALTEKSVAIFGDAKLSGRADQGIITERLLTISGEDSVTIDRKFREPWTGKFTTRFFIHSNELPRLNDNSGALLGRFIVLTLERSFLGQEDRHLKKKLQAELPGILCWAIEGLHRLQKRGHFIQPKSAIEAIDELYDLTSPLTAFLDDKCQIGAGNIISCQRLYDAWCSWCDTQGQKPNTLQTFGRDLRAALPWLRISQKRTNQGRFRHYEGITLKDNGDPI